MWARARLCFSPVKGNYIPQTHNITRHLRTQCTNFHPRGYRKRDAAETSHSEVINDDGIAGVSHPTVPHSHRDTRSIDSVDPVVLKYTNMINELRSQSSGVEKVNATHFGSIRFDNENVPHLHGHFDQEYGPVATPKPKTKATLHLKLDNTRGQSEVVKVVEQEHLENSRQEGFVNLHEPETKLNAYEEQVKVGEESNMKNSNSAADSDNYIEESIFGASPSPTSRDFKPPVLDGLQSTAVTDNVSQVKGNQKFNYIDDVFFKDSLENLSLNREPAVDYSEIKKDLEDAVLSGDKHRARDGKEETHVTQNTNKRENETDRDKTKEGSNTTKNDEAPKSALEYVKRIRREEHKKKHGLATQGTGDGSNKSYKKILSVLNEQTKDKYTRYEVLKSLKSSIIYNDHDIVGLHKCYGLAMHGGTDSRYHILTEYLPELAEFLQAEALYPVHRLDATTTGVVLLARTPAMADNLKHMFKERLLKKTYWAILKNIPETTQGIIDIPVAEGILDGRRRMVLKPDVKGVKSTVSASKMAVTKFRMISKRESAALVELSPMTGAKHQLRVHMAFGLSCPVLGDHKYSHLKKMAPQALPGDMLDKLKIKQSKVRHLPLFLHCKSITVPEVVDGRNIHITAKLPAYFNKALELLKLNRYQSKVRLDELVASVS